MGCAVFVLGPAGAGKSTFCKNLQSHLSTQNRPSTIINLDPASTALPHPVDIRNYITTTDLQESEDCGPNGAILTALSDFYDSIADIPEIEGHEYVLVDCPGQIELYMHSRVLSGIVEHFGGFYRCCAVYLVDGGCCSDSYRYLGGVLGGMVCMSRMRVPYLGVYTKMDTVGDIRVDGLKKGGSRMERVLYEFVEDSGIEFMELDYCKEEDVERVLYAMDSVMQYYDDV